MTPIIEDDGAIRHEIVRIIVAENGHRMCLKRVTGAFDHTCWCATAGPGGTVVPCPALPEAATEKIGDLYR